MLQYKIPQNVGIEDKIVGPFSLRQLIIVAVGAGISYVIFIISSRLYELNILEYILIALPAFFAIAIAMIKIHNVTFGKYLLLVLEFAIKPKKRLWDHRGIAALVTPDLTTDTEKAAQKKQAEARDQEINKKSVNLSDLSAMLDSGGFDNVQVAQHEDIDEATDEDLITEAYFGHKKKESPTGNMYWRTKEVQKKKLDILAKMPKPPTAKAKTAAAPQAAPAAAPTTPQTPPPQPPAAAAPKTEPKKASVADHLAKVIRDARETNQQKQTAATPQPEAAPAEQTAQEKKRRKRKRKPKQAAQPVRKDTEINTTDKNIPAVQSKRPTEAEIHAEDLQKGSEIEFNLD